MQGSYETAAETIDSLAREHPTDPSVLLLKGHIYCYGLHQYDIAQQQYKSVLHLSSDPEFVDYANNGLAYAAEAAGQMVDAVSPMPDEFDDGLSEAADSFEAVDGLASNHHQELEANWADATDMPDESLDAFDNFSAFSENELPSEMSASGEQVNELSDLSANLSANLPANLSANSAELDNPFEYSPTVESTSFAKAEGSDNPFEESNFITEDLEAEDPLAATLEADPFSFDMSEDAANEGGVTTFNDASGFDMEEFDEAFGISGVASGRSDASLSSSKEGTASANFDAFSEETDSLEDLSFNLPSDESDAEDKTFFMMDSDPSERFPSALSDESEPSTSATLADNASSLLDVDELDISSGNSVGLNSGGSNSRSFGANSYGEDSYGEDSYGEDSYGMGASNDTNLESDLESDAVEHSSEPTAFGDAFDDFDDFESISDFDLSDSSAGFTSPSMGALPSQLGGALTEGQASFANSSSFAASGGLAGSYF